jgi:hypothetical protein
MTEKPIAPVDMSPEGIDARLRDLRELYALARSLQQVKFLGPAAQ